MRPTAFVTASRERALQARLGAPPTATELAAACGLKARSALALRSRLRAAGRWPFPVPPDGRPKGPPKPPKAATPRKPIAPAPTPTPARGATPAPARPEPEAPADVAGLAAAVRRGRRDAPAPIAAAPMTRGGPCRETPRETCARMIREHRAGTGWRWLARVDRRPDDE